MAAKSIRAEMLAIREITSEAKNKIHESQSTLLTLLRKSKRYTMISKHHQRTEESMAKCIDTLREEIDALKSECQQFEEKIEDLISELPESKTREMLKILSWYQRVKWE